MNTSVLLDNNFFKMRKISVLFATWVLMLLATTTQAQETPEKVSLSLTEAKEFALQHSRTIKSSDLAIQKSEKAKWQAISSMLPHVSAELGYNSFLGFELNLMGQTIPMNDYGTFTGTASMAFSGLQLVAVNLSKLAISMAELSKTSAEIDVKSNATSAYYSVLVAEESKRILEKSKSNLEALYQSTLSLVNVGMAEQTDADLLSVQVMSMENSIRSAERNIELAYNSMRLVLGVDPNTQITLTQNLETLLQQNKATESYTTPFDINQNINVKLLDKNIELSNKQLSMKKWNYGPTLAAFYQYTGKSYFGKDEGFNMSPNNTVGATFSIPIFSSAERLSQVRQAQFDVKTAELNKEEAVDGLLVQEKQLRFNLKSALETYEMQKKNVEVYEKIFQKTTEKYEQGTVSSTELTTISNNLLSAQGTYISALMELFSAQTSLQKLLNTL